MCWNREVSVVTGITSVALSSFLMWRNKGNDIPIALITFAVALMQFAEALMWEGLNEQDSAKGNLGGRLGITALFLQPIILGTACLYFGGVGVVPTILFGIVGILISTPSFYKMIRKEWNPPATIGCNGHLSWLFTSHIRKSAFGLFYWVTMLGAWLFLQPRMEGIFYSTIATISVLLTIQFYPDEWGSLWCFMANFLPITRLFL